LSLRINRNELGRREFALALEFGDLFYRRVGWTANRNIGRAEVAALIVAIGVLETYAGAPPQAASISALAY
jgi:hypothetical protein